MTAAAEGVFNVIRGAIGASMDLVQLTDVVGIRNDCLERGLKSKLVQVCSLQIPFLSVLCLIRSEGFLLSMCTFSARNYRFDLVKNDSLPCQACAADTSS